MIIAALNCGTVGFAISIQSLKLSSELCCDERDILDSFFFSVQKCVFCLLLIILYILTTLILLSIYSFLYIHLSDIKLCV